MPSDRRRPVLLLALLGLAAACASPPAALSERLTPGETRLLRPADGGEAVLLRLDPDQTGWIARLPAGRPVEAAAIRRIDHWWAARGGEICHLSRRLTPEPGTGTDLDCIHPARDGLIRLGHRLHRDHGAVPIALGASAEAAPVLQGAPPPR